MFVIKTHEIEYIVKLAVSSANLRNEKPVNLMVYAPPEHGKTEILKKFAENKQVFYSTDFNMPIFEEFARKYPEKNIIMIPDFLKLVKGKYSKVANATTMLNAIMEEGWKGRIVNFEPKEKITAGLITALTRSELFDKRHKWTQLGFLSRLVPVSFMYSPGTISTIRSYIKDRMYTTERPISAHAKKVKISLTKDVADAIEKIAIKFNENENILGFRLQKQLQTLAMSNAMIAGRNMTIIEDAKIIQQLSKFINFNFEEV